MKDFISEFWDAQAREHRGKCSASWGDRFAIDLEIKTLAKYIPDNKYVLNAGCANGYSFFKQVPINSMREAVGIDYSEPMIREAQIQLDELNLRNVSVKVADIKELPFADGQFDVTYATRVLINLHNWGDQLKGINECLRVTKTGGIFVLMEGFWEPLIKLNAMRAICGLPPLVEHDFNRYLKKDRLEEFLNRKGLAWKCDKWSSVYYLGTRLLRDLVPNIGQAYTSEFNMGFYEMAKKYSGGDFGVQEAYIIEK